MFDRESSRQSVGSRRWPGVSSRTITLREDERTPRLRSATARTARCGAQVPAQLPTIRVTSGRRVFARCFAQRYHLLHGLPASSQVRGMQLTLTSGSTTQWSRWAMSRIVGIHICACESPMTTIAFLLDVSPSRQTRLFVWLPRGTQPLGKL